jgi:hypothetical protein
MTSWGWLILIGAVLLGLKRQMDTRHRYLAAFMIVLVAISWAALRQHAY